MSDRQRDRQPEKQTDRTDSYADRQTDRTDTLTDRQLPCERQTALERETQADITEPFNGSVQVTNRL